MGLCDFSKPEIPVKTAELSNLSISKSAFIGEASVFLFSFVIEDVTSLSAEAGSLLLVLTPEILFLGIAIFLFIKCVVC